MKKYIIILCLSFTLFGYGQKRQHPKPRYFFIAYRTPDQYGNLMWCCNDGSVPNKHEIVKYYNEVNKDSIAFKYYIITGMYEFRTRKEADLFFKNQGGK